MADKRVTAKAAAPTADNKKNQRNQSGNRLDLLWTLLKDKKNLKNHEKLLRKHRNATVRVRTLDTSVALRLHKSDLDSLIKNRGLSWETLHEYCTNRFGLVVGPILISDSEMDDECPYTYIVNFREFSLYTMQKPDKLNTSELKSMLDTVFKLLSSRQSLSNFADDYYDIFGEFEQVDVSLVETTTYYKLLEELNIGVESLLFDGAFIEDCEFVRWVVENVSNVSLDGTFLEEPWTVFCDALASSFSKVETLNMYMAGFHSLEPSLPDLIKNSPTIKSFEVETLEIGDLIPFTTMNLEPGRTVEIAVEGLYDKDDWIAGLAILCQCRLFSSIDYRSTVANDYGESIFFTDTGKKAIVDIVRGNDSLVALTWDFDEVGNLDIEFHMGQIQPILDERAFQKQAVGLGATLESHGIGIGLLSKLLSSAHVLNSPATLYGILKENVPLLKHLWDSSQDARIARLELIMLRSIRDFEAAKASKEERAAIFST